MVGARSCLLPSFPGKQSEVRSGVVTLEEDCSPQMIKVLAAEEGWLSPVAQRLHADEDGRVPSAVSRKMLLNSCSRNPEKAVPERFGLPRYYTVKG